MSKTPFSEKSERLGRLMALCERLRREDGCPWDREQTLRSLTPYLLEEVHETLDAISSGDRDTIREELGDLLYVVTFALHAAEVESIASVDEVVDAISEKLIRRHPHVFGDNPSRDVERARTEWQNAKRRESGDSKRTVLDKLPTSHPALLAAYRLQEKASAVGFDWKDVQGPIEKVEEELGELRESIPSPDKAQHEVGDLLFAVVNVARLLSIDPEVALRGANRRFFDRFHYIEERLAAEERRPEDASLEEMDALWDEAKGRSSDQ